MTDRQHSPRPRALDETIDEVLREVAGGDRSVNLRARVLNRLGDGSAPGPSSIGVRWQSRWAVPAVGIAGIAVVAVVATLLVRGPSPSTFDGRTVAPGGTSAHRAEPAGQPPDAQRSPGPVVSSSAGGSAPVVTARTPATGGLARQPRVMNRPMRGWPAADGAAAEDAAAEGATPAIAIQPLSMDPLAAPAPVHVSAIQIDPIVVPDIKIDMIEIKPLDAGSAPRPPDPGKPQQR
jgi:hypothetical protein